MTWLAQKDATWRPHTGTRATIESWLRNHILPEFGDYYIDRITRRDVKRWLTAQTGAASSVANRLGLLKNILAEAARDFGFPLDLGGIQAPPGARKPGGRDMVLMPEEVARVIDFSAEYEPAWHPMVVLGLGAGGRPSEVLVPLVGDLQLDDEIGTWEISRHLVRATNTVAPGAKGKPEGVTAFLDPITTALLRTVWRRRRATAGADAYLFPGRAKTGCKAYNSLLGALDRIRKGADIDLPLSGKVFRQTYITLSRMAGANAALTMANVGHSSRRVHALYNRPTDPMRAEAARAMAEVIHLDEHRELESDQNGDHNGDRGAESDR